MSWKLSRGKGATEEDACFAQRAGLLHAQQHGYADKLPIWVLLYEHPCWMNNVVNGVAMFCNDKSTDEQLERLAPLVWRSLDCVKKPPEVEHRINARLLCQQARKVLHLVPDEHREVCERAIATREAWLRGEATEAECHSAAQAADALWAAEANWAAEAAGAAGAVDIADDADAAQAAHIAGQFGPEEWVADLLDAWEKAAAAEGVLHDTSEADRLVAAFVQRYGAST